MKTLQLSELINSNARGTNCMQNRTRFASPARFAGYALVCALFFAASLPLSAAPRPQASQQASYSSPDDALQALVTAAKEKDHSALTKLFGSDYNQLLTGDAEEDSKDLSDFATAVEESAKLQRVTDTKYTVVVGNNGWPTPIPIVQKDGKWMFDTRAGLDEVMNRRIGENELSAIETCRAYAVAQWEYYTEGDWDHDGVAEYAQRFISTPGKHDGLFWETAEGEKPSPLGTLVAQARAEGYGPKPQTAGGAASGETATPHAPYHGYHFKILTAQGPHAAGGKYGYIINGNMIAGYALAAYPASWGKSGVMTFIINQQGRVYEKNLGANTAKIAAAMTTYDPDPSWKLAPNEP
jgi:DUF2950 family protein